MIQTLLLLLMVAESVFMADYYSSAVKSEPGSSAAEDADSLFANGINSYNRKKYNKCIEYITRAIDIESERSGFYSRRGECYEKLRQFTNAEQDYRKAMKYDQTEMYGRERLGKMLYQLGKYYEAAQVLSYFDQPGMVAHYTTYNIYNLALQKLNETPKI